MQEQLSFVIIRGTDKYFETDRNKKAVLRIPRGGECKKRKRD